MSIYGISLFGMTMCFWMKRRHLEWRIKIVVLLKTCPGLIRKRYTDQSFFAVIHIRPAQKDINVPCLNFDTRRGKDMEQTS